MLRFIKDCQLEPVIQSKQIQTTNWFSSFFSEKNVWHFMQIASVGDNLHAMSNPIFCEKKKATKKNIS